MPRIHTICVAGLLLVACETPPPDAYCHDTAPDSLVDRRSGARLWCEEIGLRGGPEGARDMSIAALRSWYLLGISDCSDETFPLLCEGGGGYASITAVSNVALNSDNVASTVSTWLGLDEDDAIDPSRSPYGKTRVQLDDSLYPRVADLIDNGAHLRPAFAGAIGSGATSSSTIDLRGSGLRLTNRDEFRSNLAEIREAATQRIDWWDAATNSYDVGTPEPLDSDYGTVSVDDATIELTARSDHDDERVLVFLDGPLPLIGVGNERTAREALALEEDWESLLPSQP